MAFMYYLLFFFLLATTSRLLEAQGMVLPATYKGEAEPVFDKIYVTQSQLVQMPEGTFYYDDNGCEIKVHTLLYDQNGMYILRVRHQCKLCGRTYIDRLPKEEEGCPINEEEVFPGIWRKNF